MSFSIERWLEDYCRTVEKFFGERVWFVGLQGSYGRGEAGEGSDIDVVLILEELESRDLAAYRKLLDGLPERARICGFVSGRQELLAWEPSDLFQFCHDTVPLRGSLEQVLSQVRREDIQRAVHLGVCNLYHLCGHNMVHEQSGDILRGLYKSAAFTLQAICYLQTGRYVGKRAQLRPLLQPDERAILNLGVEMKARGPLSEPEFWRLSEALFSWSGSWIRRYGATE